MRRIAAGALVGLVATLITSAPAEAVQPPAKCRTISATSEPGFVAMGHKFAPATVTTTTQRCRGKIVRTVTYAVTTQYGGSR